MRRTRIRPICFLVSAFFIFGLLSCRKDRADQRPISGGILLPFTEEGAADDAEGGNERGLLVEQTVLPLVNPGENYNILIIYEVNLDLEQSDEQILVSVPLDDESRPLELMIASINPVRNEYTIVWSHSMSTRSLAGITLRVDDLTGNGRNDIVVAGFDTTDRHVTEVYAVPKNGDLDRFSRVFSLAVDGNIDIVTVGRSASYSSGLSAGNPYRIVVQGSDPDSENFMDMVETEWEWSPGEFAYRQGESRYVKAETILEKRIGSVYTGGVKEYENFLSGAWYRQSSDRAHQEILYFDTRTREILFYDGAIQEVFIWGPSHRTTAKRLYARVNNSVIPSLSDTVWVSAESWETIELTRARADDWNGSYRRLGESLQAVMNAESSLASLLEPLSFTGVWRSQGDEQIIFDLPRIDWTRNGNTRSGTASVFSVDGRMVLQVRFIKRNGGAEETANWLAVYKEDRDETRIIRSLSLSSALLDAGGVRPLGQESVRFEQIELLSAG